MNVEIRKEEYTDLLDLLHIASWVLVYHKTAQDARIEKYDRIIQKFYALANDLGHSDLVVPDQTGKYRPSGKFEESSPSREIIDEFVDHSFWDELIIRFAERDAARRAGGFEQLGSLSHEDRHALEDPIEERYTEEFNENGIDRLEIVEGYGQNFTHPPATHD